MPFHFHVSTCSLSLAGSKDFPSLFNFSALKLAFCSQVAVHSPWWDAFPPVQKTRKAGLYGPTHVPRSRKVTPPWTWEMKAFPLAPSLLQQGNPPKQSCEGAEGLGMDNQNHGCPVQPHEDRASPDRLNNRHRDHFIPHFSMSVSVSSLLLLRGQTSWRCSTPVPCSSSLKIQLKSNLPTTS